MQRELVLSSTEDGSALGQILMEIILEQVQLIMYAMAALASARTDPTNGASRIQPPRWNRTRSIVAENLAHLRRTRTIGRRPQVRRKGGKVHRVALRDDLRTSLLEH